MSTPALSEADLSTFFKRQQFEIAKRNSMYPNRIFSGSFAPCGAGYTFRQKFEVPFVNQNVLVRAVYENDTATAFGITAASIASGRAWADPNDNPLLASTGSASPWTKIYGAPFSIPAGSASFSTNGQSGIGYTPWTPLQIQPRTDGASNGLIYLNTYSTASFRGQVGNSAYPFYQWSSIASLNFRSSTSFEYGDYTSANQSAYNPGTNVLTNYVPAWIEILTAEDVVTIANAGDSTDQGYTSNYVSTTSGVWGWLAQAANNLSSVGRPVAWQNYGSAGMTSTFIMGQRRALISDANRRPTILVMQPFSQNDDSFGSMATAQSAWANIVTDIQSCISAGITPVVRTLQPTVTASTTAQEQVRLWVNSQVRSLNTTIFDIDVAVSAGGYPATIVPSYTDDGTHLNDAGNAIAAQRLIQDIGFLIR